MDWPIKGPYFTFHYIARTNHNALNSANILHSHKSLSKKSSPWSQSRNPFGNNRVTPLVAPTSIDILGKSKSKNEAKENKKRGTQLVKAHVATERQTWTKKQA